MRCGRMNWTVAAVCCLCGVVAGSEPAPEPAEDVNEPWIAAEHLAPGWQSMALTTEYCNPEMPAWESFPPLRTILLKGEIAVTDPDGLVGLATQPTDTCALDEAGAAIHTIQTISNAPLYAPLRYATTVVMPAWEWKVEIVPHEFFVEMRMDPETPFPASLSRIEWSMEVLLSDEFAVIDLPFAPSDGWIELAPDLDILVTEATVEDEQYHYCIEAKYDPNKVLYLRAEAVPSAPAVRRPGVPAPTARDVYSWTTQMPPEAIVVEISVLDAEGNWVHRQGTSGGSELISTNTNRDSDGLIVTRCVTGHCPACGNAAIIRYVIARNPYQQEASFVLEDIPVPTF